MKPIKSEFYFSKKRSNSHNYKRNDIPSFPARESITELIDRLYQLDLPASSIAINQQ
jgi:hypothetical protein|tara:strand:+ start:3020 stop:3190 length:171 start_codon:yes stop_codon:yes gene_type:complete